MADGDLAPYVSQDVQAVAQLIRSLEACSKKTADGTGKKPVRCKKNTYTLPGPDKLTVDSWRFQDWDYHRSDLPTYARGLFTHSTQQRQPEIVVRGYDKFFNTGEVPKTNWRNIETHTRGPYELSLKENGCIIFISGMPNDNLLVCSKHSTGLRQDNDVSHAVAGERWVDRHLRDRGRSRADLARELRRMNATAVAELCDDDFEEHILAYRDDQAGLYLHGINLNIPEFATYPGHLVHRFADDWGFRKTDFLVKEDVSDVRTFLEGVAQSGSWQGRDVEGFVIRCQARDGEAGRWHDWFFKYKFEEPYLMFRQWREVTKAVIAGRPPKYRKHKQITDEYLMYARRQLSQNPNLGKEFNHNHGIIAMRDGFLQQKGLRGSDLARLESNPEDDDTAVTHDVILVPVATIGCGKTTVAVALTKLFGWAHVQNDNIVGKNRPQRFAGDVCSGLASSKVVIADRNNHQRRERKQLIDDVRRIVPKARIVAMHYLHRRAPETYPSLSDEIRKTTRDRVFARGDSHQTIQAGSDSQHKIIGIMEGFMSRFEPVNQKVEPDDGFDAVIDLNVLASSRENLETVVSHLHDLYPKVFETLPTPGDLDDAIEYALRNYKPDIHHSIESSRNKPVTKPARQTVEFFAINLPTSQVMNSLEAAFTSQPADTARFFRLLQQSRRVQVAFHVTLIHSALSRTHPDKWNHLSSFPREPVSSNGPNATLGHARVELERVIWDNRVMCIVVRILDGQDKGFTTINQIPHVTVGTANQSIKPKESNDLLSAWLARGSGEESGIGELPLDPKTTLTGTVTAVMSR